MNFPSLLESKLALSLFLAAVFVVVLAVQVGESILSTDSRRVTYHAYMKAAVDLMAGERQLDAMDLVASSGNVEQQHLFAKDYAAASNLARSCARCLKIADASSVEGKQEQLIQTQPAPSGGFRKSEKQQKLSALRQEFDQLRLTYQKDVERMAEENRAASEYRLSLRAFLTIGLFAVILYLAYSLRYYIDSRNRAERAVAEANAKLLIANGQLDELAHIDPLTQVLNRRGLERLLATELARAKRSKEPICALFIDCDDFKSINEKHGHAGGDAVLRAVAQRTASSVRATDLVARIGGDEFMVIMPGTSLEESSQIAERVRACISADPLLLESGTVASTISLGLAKLSVETKDLEALLTLTREALQSSKSTGKNRLTVLS
jgi:diguanylate cyclase (GGDEF)-like protein